LSPKLSVVYSQETCEIYPESFLYGFQGEIEIRASGIEKGKKYGLILPTDMGYLEVTAIDDQLIKANLLYDNSLQRSGEIEVRRANIGRTLICTANIVVEAEETPPLPEEEEEPEAPSYIDTAIGRIDVSSPEAFVNKILTFALGIGGGIAILLIIIGGVQVLTSAGNPDKVKAGQELITSAVSGLLLIIFAVFLLKLIGKDILKIPGFEP